MVSIAHINLSTRVWLLHSLGVRYKLSLKDLSVESTLFLYVYLGEHKIVQSLRFGLKFSRTVFFLEWKDKLIHNTMLYAYTIHN